MKLVVSRNVTIGLLCSSFIYNNKVYALSKIDTYQEAQNYHSKIEKKMGKVLLVWKIFVPLHPLNEKRMF